LQGEIKTDRQDTTQERSPGVAQPEPQSEPAGSWGSGPPRYIAPGGLPPELAAELAHPPQPATLPNPRPLPDLLNRPD
jgi:hypothetical protein